MEMRPYLFIALSEQLLIHGDKVLDKHVVVEHARKEVLDDWDMGKMKREKGVGGGG
jgi:hypothetical protein